MSDLSYTSNLSDFQPKMEAPSLEPRGLEAPQPGVASVNDFGPLPQSQSSIGNSPFLSLSNSLPMLPPLGGSPSEAQSVPYPSTSSQLQLPFPSFPFSSMSPLTQQPLFQQQYAMYLSNYLRGQQDQMKYSFKRPSDANRSHRRRFGAAGGRVRAGESIPDPATMRPRSLKPEDSIANPPLPLLPSSFPSLTAVESQAAVDAAGNQAANVPPNGTLETGEPSPPNVEGSAVPEGENKDGSFPPAPTQPVVPPAGALTVSSLYDESEEPPIDREGIIERLCTADKPLKDDTVPPESTREFQMVRMHVGDQGYNFIAMKPYNPQLNFLPLLAREIAYTRRDVQDVRLSQRRRGNMRYMTKKDFRPDYPGLFDDCSVYCLDLHTPATIADFCRCGDNEMQYSFGKPMTKKFSQLLEFNNMRYTEYYSTCQGVLVCPQAVDKDSERKHCVRLKATSSRCRTCTGHGCPLKHVRCDVRLIKYVLEETQPSGADVRDVPEKYLLVCVGQHKHPIPPPTNVPFKLVWELEDYVERNENLTASEIWPKLHGLHPTLDLRETVREIVRQVRLRQHPERARTRNTTGSLYLPFPSTFFGYPQLRYPFFPQLPMAPFSENPLLASMMGGMGGMGYRAPGMNPMLPFGPFGSSQPGGENLSGLPNFALPGMGGGLPFGGTLPTMAAPEPPKQQVASWKPEDHQALNYLVQQCPAIIESFLTRCGTTVAECPNRFGSLGDLLDAMLPEETLAVQQAVAKSVSSEDQQPQENTQVADECANEAALSNNESGDDALPTEVSGMAEFAPVHTEGRPQSSAEGADGSSSSSSSSAFTDGEPLEKRQRVE